MTTNQSILSALFSWPACDYSS